MPEKLVERPQNLVSKDLLGVQYDILVDPDLGGTYRPFDRENPFKDTLALVRSKEPLIISLRRRGSDFSKYIVKEGQAIGKILSTAKSTVIEVVSKGSERLLRRRGRRPRGRCPDCGAIYIISLGHSGCRSKKAENKSELTVSLKKAA